MCQGVYGKGVSDWGLSYSEGAYLVFKQINDQLWIDLEQKRITKEELFACRWSRIFDALGIRKNGPEFEGLFKSYLYDAAIPVEGAVDMLAYLAGKYQVYAVSNGSQSQQCNRLKNAGMLPYLRDVFTSERMGYQKPLKEFFDGVYACLGGVKPRESILIGDSLSADMRGAVPYEIHTIWLNREHKDPPADLVVDFEIDSLSDVEFIL